MDEKGNPKSIKLPETIEAFRNLKNAKRFAVDIGKLFNVWCEVYAIEKELLNG